MDYYLIRIVGEGWLDLEFKDPKLAERFMHLEAFFHPEAKFKIEHWIKEIGICDYADNEVLEIMNEMIDILSSNYMESK